MSHEGYFNIINASHNYLFVADSNMDGKDHIAEVRPDVSNDKESLDLNKFWWKLEPISGQRHDGHQVYRIFNEEYGYLFAADNDEDDGRAVDEDHSVEARKSPDATDLAKPKYQWTIIDDGRRLDWSLVKNLAYGYMFAADRDMDGTDHVVECRPKGKHDDLKYQWFCANWCDLESWMQYVPDDRSLSALSIPGTHDSGSQLLPSGLGRTQALTMDQQLRMGARFIDCRLQIQVAPNGKVVEPPRLCFSHELAQINWIQFDAFVKDTLIAFLKAHPTECIILSIHDEESLRSDDWEWQKFAELVSRNIHDSANSDFWYTENRIPDLIDVRKKIVLVRRYKTSDEHNTGTAATAYGKIGINARSDWGDNRTFTAANGPIRLNVQDIYSIDSNAKILDTKWPAVKKQLRDARNRGVNDPSDKTLYMNFLSAVGPKSTAGRPTAWTIAESINPNTLNYLNDKDHRQGRYGIVAGDFFGANLFAAIVASNSML